MLSEKRLVPASTTSARPGSTSGSLESAKNARPLYVVRYRQDAWKKPPGARTTMGSSCRFKKAQKVRSLDSDNDAGSLDSLCYCCGMRTKIRMNVASRVPSAANSTLLRRRYAFHGSTSIMFFASA